MLTSTKHTGIHKNRMQRVALGTEIAPSWLVMIKP